MILTRRTFIARSALSGLAAWGLGTPLLWQFVWPRPVFAADYPYPMGSFIVGNESELQGALEKHADAGIAIVLKPGTYRGDFKARRGGTKENPLVIRAQEPGRSIIDGSLVLEGDNITAHGLVADNGPDFAIRMGGRGNKLMRSTLTGTQGLAVEEDAVDWYAGFNAFDNRTRENHNGIVVHTKSGGGAEPGMIERNLFKSGARGNGERHAIYLGQQKMDSRPTIDVTISRNLIGTPAERYTERRGIYCKHGCNLDGNAQYMTRGTCLIRHGANARITGNLIDGAHDCTINGEGHVLEGNVIRNARLDLMAETRSGSSANDGRGNLYQAADEAKVQGNAVSRMTVGKRLARLDREVRGVTIEDHEGQVALEAETGTKKGGGGSASAASSTRIAMLTENDVGPGASASPSSGHAVVEEKGAVAIPENKSWKPIEYGKGYVKPEEYRGGAMARQSIPGVRMRAAPPRPGIED